MLRLVERLTSLLVGDTTCLEQENFGAALRQPMRQKQTRNARPYDAESASPFRTRRQFFEIDMHVGSSLPKGLDCLRMILCTPGYHRHRRSG